VAESCTICSSCLRGQSRNFWIHPHRLCDHQKYIECSMRPITDAVGSPPYQLAKQRVGLLSPLVGLSENHTKISWLLHKEAADNKCKRYPYTCEFSHTFSLHKGSTQGDITAPGKIPNLTDLYINILLLQWEVLQPDRWSCPGASSCTSHGELLLHGTLWTTGNEHNYTQPSKLVQICGWHICHLAIQWRTTEFSEISELYPY
jgi:hypothetical protein